MPCTIIISTNFETELYSIMQGQFCFWVVRLESLLCIKITDVFTSKKKRLLMWCSELQLSDIMLDFVREKRLLITFMQSISFVPSTHNVCVSTYQNMGTWSLSISLKAKSESQWSGRKLMIRATFSYRLPLVRFPVEHHHCGSRYRAIIIFVESLVWAILFW